MKIYINGKFLSQKITGVQRVALQYLNELEKNYSGKFEIVVVENKYKGIWSILFEQVILPFKTRGHLLINFCNISPIFKRHQITYIHDVAFIALNRHSFFFRMYYRFMMYFVTRNSLKIITVSEFSKAELLKHYNNLNDSSVVVVRNGADFTHEYTLVNSIIELKSKYKKIFLTVSSLEPRKNLSFILKAWSLKKSNNELLIIVGGKSEHFKQEDLASNIENVIFNGFLSNLMSNLEKKNPASGGSFLTKINTTKNERLRKPPSKQMGGGFLSRDSPDHSDSLKISVGQTAAQLG